jgi:Asp-tRNA(Asn)/Glu-tRNA(Gln) amidotransferase A subunit family amidase
MTARTLSRIFIIVNLVCGASFAGCRSAPVAPPTDTVASSGAPRFELVESSIRDLQAALSSGRVTSSELVAMYEARIAAYDADGPKLNSISVLNPQAAEEAKARDAERKSNQVRGPLHGIPVIVKDNYETSNMQTAAGSRALAGFIPQRDAFLVTKLKNAGAIIIAKANMDEFGLGISGQGSLFGQTRNPYALDRIPGGSSAGPAVATAANLAAAALGSDTCGSIRMPAAHNALVGLRGTQGLLSRSGIVPLGHTQDMGAPIARSVTDVAILLDALVGYDAADGQTAEAVTRSPASYAAGLSADALRGARIGLVTDLLGTDPENQETIVIIRKATADMKARGAEVIDVSIDNIEELVHGTRFRGFMVPAYEVKYDLARYFASLPNKPPASSIDEILAANPATWPTFWLKNAQTVESLEVKEYTDALLRRNVLRQLLLTTMANHRVDVLAYPTYRVKPGLLSGKEKAQSNNCAVGSNSGLPSISVPAGWTDDNLPIGIELLGRAWSEGLILKLAFSFEQATHHRRSPKSTPPLPAGPSR